MSFRDILVFLDGGAASEGRLQLAARIARDNGAFLTGVFLQNGHATGSRPRFAAPWLGLVAGPPNAGAVVTLRVSEPADIAEQQFRDCLRSLNLEGDWHPVSRVDTRELITLAQAADLVIIGQVNPEARPVPTWRPDEELRPHAVAPSLPFELEGSPAGFPADERFWLPGIAHERPCGRSTTRCH